jgi:hypothetical protein
MGNSLVMVISVCLEGDLVGDAHQSGAFVYGAMSFTDKVSNGIAILLIQNVRESYIHDAQADGAFVRRICCYLPAMSVMLGNVMITLMKFRCVSRATASVHGEHPQRDNETKDESSNLLWKQQQPNEDDITYGATA